MTITGSILSASYTDVTCANIALKFQPEPRREPRTDVSRGKTTIYAVEQFAAICQVVPVSVVRAEFSKLSALLRDPVCVELDDEGRIIAVDTVATEHAEPEQAERPLEIQAP